MDFSIRAATMEDCRDIERMIKLAESQKMSDHVKITLRDLEQDGFSDNPFFHCLVAEVSEQHRTKDGHTKIGCVFFWYSYNTWEGRAVYMENLYVMAEFRGYGIGKALMGKVAQLGLAAGCHQLKFMILEWNKPALDFYVTLGCYDATTVRGFHCMRCEGKGLQDLAQP